MADWTTPTAIHSKCGETAPQLATLSIDENTATYWQHNVTCYHWIIFDMGATKIITKIRFYDGSYWGGTYGLSVYVSDNPADWGTPVWEGVRTGIGWVESDAFEKNGRYIKLVTKASVSAQRFHEFDALVAGATHYKTVSEILGLVDAKTYEYGCQKCKPSSVTVVF